MSRHVTYRSNRSLFCSLTLFSCCLLLVSGCGGSPDGPELHFVYGTVSYDGELIEDGRILFRPMNGGAAYSAPITQGTYEVETVAGDMRVEITATREVPGKFVQASPDEEPVPAGEMFIPDKYNVKSELTTIVKEDEDNDIGFSLASK